MTGHALELLAIEMQLNHPQAISVFGADRALLAVRQHRAVSDKQRLVVVQLGRAVRRGKLG